LPVDPDEHFLPLQHLNKGLRYLLRLGITNSHILPFKHLLYPVLNIPEKDV
jgi:hypothetical protein